MNTLVNFEIAKVLKEKGFKNGIHYDGVGGYFTNTTIAEVVMWLYDKHGIYIHISPYGEEEDLFVDCKWWFGIYKDKLFNLLGGSKVTEGIEDFNSLIEAYEAAIEYTLNKLIK